MLLYHQSRSAGDPSCSGGTSRAPQQMQQRKAVVSRSKSQLNKHCIKTENFLKTKTSSMQASGGSGAPRRQRSMSIALPNEDEDARYSRLPQYRLLRGIG